METDPNLIDPYHDPLAGEYEAACSWEDCGWTAKLKLNLGMKLQVGDKVYRDPSNERVGKCVKCKRYSLVITKVPEGTGPVQPRGFWKIPTE